jgi:beta-alanine--pyruvate transaminase
MDLEKRTEIPNSLEEHWMPFTSNRDYKNSPRLMVKAEGVYYTDHYGNQLIDASSGLFCSPAGHSRPEIREAVSNQLEQLDYVQPFQQGFGGSFDLARKISKHTPEDLNKIFFTICGSSAVETAIKTAIAYFKAKGEGHRSHIVGRERGYHGMNIGGISVGGC